MYAILGATGHIGSTIADILLTKGEKIRVIARSVDRLRPLVKRGAEAFAGDAADPAFLTKAFKGADAAFTLVPPNLTAKDFLAYADTMSKSIAKAVKDGKVKYVVNLSSIGADLPEGTGPIVGLHRQEERLNKIAGLNIVHLRAAFFMENLLMNIDLIRTKGIAGSAAKGDIAFPMIATKDIAQVAASLLVKRDFKGSSVRYLLGQRELTHNEAITILGSRIGKPDLAYAQFPYDGAEKGLTTAGLSPDMSRLYIEMTRAFNEGRVKTGLVRTPESTTPTSLEEFAEVFDMLYRKQKAA
ncbi:MAG: hypothetical protein A2X56_09125 [Nitrospirae bacterium GWC2_57_13]|jgi:uncharacterized protein YbjT (DUF2867 family)|nr:MAG: hypothetical protein A2X56_09125 [Nitrospirae bacterium GWC2_57_13]OGW46936.1 MAG: hypothetical protein A2X57_09910 [Nitrospirae bacterium GWD2_57_8]HAR46904.1 FMN-dependent NADH-azoreductase [Nitrospiraceae bacterium]HAS53355.1 FMN-dependent NADH-azoreductase [Nitrospiraceae bacterium]